MKRAPELADCIVQAAEVAPNLVRIKEVIESIETFLAIENFLIAIQPYQEVLPFVILYSILNLICTDCWSLDVEYKINFSNSLLST